MTHRTEPCISCGEDTCAGSPLFSDRMVAHGEVEPRFMCSLCVQLARGSREVHPMTEEERIKLEKAAFAFGSFAPGGH